MLHRSLLPCVIVLCLALAPGQASAQVRRAQTVHLGLSGGVNNTYIVNQNNYGQPELDYQIGFRPAFGLEGGYQITPSFGVHTGLRYTRRGQAYEDTIGSTEVEKHVDLAYLSLPLLADVRLGRRGIGFFLQAGPQISFLLDADVSGSGRPAQPEGRSDSDLYRTTNLDLLFEFGPYFSLSQQAYLTLGLRGLFGLTDINAEGDAIRVPNAEGGSYSGSHNAYIGLHVGLHYTLPLGS